MKKNITRSVLIIAAIGIAVSATLLDDNDSCNSVVYNLAAIFSITGCSNNTEAQQNAAEKTSPQNIVAGVSAGRITFIELGSDSCMPCRAMKPVTASIAQKYKGKVDVVFYDVWTDAGAPQAQKYNIEAIPTQVFLDAQGKEFFRHTGFFPEENIERVLASKGIMK